MGRIASPPAELALRRGARRGVLAALVRHPSRASRYAFFSGRPSPISYLRNALVSPVKWMACMPNLRAETTLGSLSSMNTQDSGDRPYRSQNTR